LQTLQCIMLLSELNFTFNWSHSMILYSQSFQWLKWLISMIHEENIMSRQDDLALIIELSSFSSNNHSSLIISFFHQESFLSFINRRKKDINHACWWFSWCTCYQWRYFLHCNKFIESLSWLISWFHQCVASTTLCQDQWLNHKFKKWTHFAIYRCNVMKKIDLSFASFFLYHWSWKSNLLRSTSLE